MSVLVDTNLLTRSLQPNNAHFSLATAALRELNVRREQLCLVPQVVYEFWTVCTRPPGENGLGLSTAEAYVEQTKVLSLFSLLTDTAAIFPEWRRLVVAHDAKGKNAHDARLVAAMIVNRISRILTFNGADFARGTKISKYSHRVHSRSPHDRSAEQRETAPLQARTPSTTSPYTSVSRKSRPA